MSSAPEDCVHEDVARQRDSREIFCISCNSFVDEETWEALPKTGHKFELCDHSVLALGSVGKKQRRFCKFCDLLMPTEPYSRPKSNPKKSLGGTGVQKISLAIKYPNLNVRELISEVEIRRYVDGDSISSWIKQGRPMRALLIDGVFYWEAHYDFLTKYNYRMPEDIYLLWLRVGEPEISNWDIDAAFALDRERQRVYEVERKKKEGRKKAVENFLGAIASSQSSARGVSSEEVMNGIRLRMCPFCRNMTRGTGPCSSCSR